VALAAHFERKLIKMPHICISKQTKSEILSKVSSGRPIDDVYLPFIGTDPAFARELIAAAQRSMNAAFVVQLKRHIETNVIDIGLKPSAPGKYNTLRTDPPVVGGRKKERLVTTREIYDAIKHIHLGAAPENYNPTGTSFEQYMAQKGAPIDLHPFSTGKPIVFLRGGAPGQGKRA